MKNRHAALFSLWTRQPLHLFSENIIFHCYSPSLTHSLTLRLISILAQPIKNSPWPNSSTLQWQPSSSSRSSSRWRCARLPSGTLSSPSTCWSPGSSRCTRTSCTTCWQTDSCCQKVNETVCVCVCVCIGAVVMWGVTVCVCVCVCVCMGVTACVCICMYMTVYERVCVYMCVLMCLVWLCVTLCACVCVCGRDSYPWGGWWPAIGWWRCHGGCDYRIRGDHKLCDTLCNSRNHV